MFGSDYGYDIDERDSIDKWRDAEIEREQARILSYKMQLKKEGTTETMEATEEIQKIVGDFGEKSIELEKMCKVLKANNMQLTKELGAARVETGHLQTEVEKMKRKNSKLELENLKLSQQVMIFNQDKEAKGASANTDHHDSGIKVGGGSDDKPQENLMDKGQHPLKVFPKEVWEMIFEHLKDPKDMKSCYDTCTTFQSMLQGQAKIFLFTDVLKILATRHPQIVEESYGQQMTLKTCRFVCHGWKQCIDNFWLEDTPSFPHLPVYSRSSRTAFNYKFTKKLSEDPLLQTMSADINPFIRRYLKYSDKVPHGTTSYEKKNYRYEFWEFLYKFGSHVWTFEPKFDDAKTESDIQTWYRKLVTWLSLMPNLKMLYLWEPLGFMFYDDSCNCENDFYEGYPFSLCLCKGGYTTCDTKKVWWTREAIYYNPFPAMPKLKIVAFQDCPASLMEAVLVANPQIERMEIHRGYHNEAGFDMNSLHLDKLYELRLTHRQILCSDFKNVSWKLRKLTLIAPNVDWDDLFEVLGKCFGETLLEFDLQLEGPCHAKSPRLYLPKLKKLKMSLTRCFNSIDFILPLIGLEHLSVNFHDMYKMQDDMDYKPLDEIIETIQFHQFTHDLKNSNIWPLFPKLKSIWARTDRGARCQDETTPAVTLKWQFCTRNHRENQVSSANPRSQELQHLAPEIEDGGEGSDGSC